MVHARTRECPLCGWTMQLKQVTRTDHVVGFNDPPPHTVREWVCSNCDYVEDVDDDTA